MQFIQVPGVRQSLPARCSNQDIPSGDKDLLIAIIKDTGQLAFVAAITRLRAAAFDLLSATSSAAARDQSVRVRIALDERHTHSMTSS